MYFRHKFLKIYKNLLKIYTQKSTYKENFISASFSSGDDLISRAVAHQVSSAQRSLTTVFGMGTGVTSSLLPPNIYTSAFSPHIYIFLNSKTSKEEISEPNLLSLFLLRSSPRPISIGQLNALPHLHLRPINHIVYMGSY